MKIVSPHIIVPESLANPPAPAPAPAPASVLEIVEKPVPMAVDFEPIRAEFTKEIQRLNDEIAQLRQRVEELSQKPAEPVALERMDTPATPSIDPGALKAELAKDIQRLEAKILESNRETFRLTEEVAALRQTLEERNTPAPAPQRVADKIAKSIEPKVEKKVENVAMHIDQPEKKDELKAPPPSTPGKVAFFGKLWDYLNDNAFETPSQKTKN